MKMDRNTVPSRFGRKGNGADGRQEVDLALAVMCRLQRPGERFSCKTIAQITGMSGAASHYIVMRALKKLRYRLSQERELLERVLT